MRWYWSPHAGPLRAPRGSWCFLPAVTWWYLMKLLNPLLLGVRASRLSMDGFERQGLHAMLW